MGKLWQVWCLLRPSLVGALPFMSLWFVLGAIPWVMYLLKMNRDITVSDIWGTCLAGLFGPFTLIFFVLISWEGSAMQRFFGYVRDLISGCIESVNNKVLIKRKHRKYT